MPPSAREAAVTALVSVLDGIAGVTVLRDEIQPQSVPAGGLIIVREANGDEAIIVEEETLGSSPVFALNHRVDVECFVIGSSAAARTTSLDTMLSAIASAIAADRTLGGKVDYSEVDAPSLGVESVEGSPEVKTALAAARLYYDAPTRQG